MCLTCTEFTVQWENKDLNESKDLKMIADVINLVYRALTVFILTDVVYRIFRSSRPEVFCKKGVLKSFAKFTEKHLCLSLFFVSFAKFLSKLFSCNTSGGCFCIYSEYIQHINSCFYCSLSSYVTLLGVYIISPEVIVSTVYFSNSWRD